MTLAITECAAAAICQLWRTACANGANFRTGLQLHNRAANEATARLVLRQAKGSTKALTYTLARRQTKSYADMASSAGQTANANRLSGAIPTNVLMIIKRVRGWSYLESRNHRATDEE